MPVIKKTNIEYQHYFDSKSNRHYINGILSVLHCHHYTCLYTQLALDAGETELLKECARESFSDLLQHYFSTHSEINTLEEKVSIASQYYALLGLGKLEVTFIGKYTGSVQLPYSHTDSGWIKKWGIYDKAVNYISGGYIEALFEVCLDMPAGSFEAVETQSIVTGADYSIFKVRRR